MDAPRALVSRRSGPDMALPIHSRDGHRNWGRVCDSAPFGSADKPAKKHGWL